MYMLIESLNKLGRLDVAVDRIEQRLPIELFAIVDKTNKEVDQHHPGHLREYHQNETGIFDFDVYSNSSRSHVLLDLLWTLYSKLEAIAEGHRAVHDVLTGIVEREGLRYADSLTGGFKELWKLYQSEVGVLERLTRIDPSTKSSRCDLYYTTTWLLTPLLPIDPDELLRPRSTYSRERHATRRR